jgi:hypothetical protein
VIRQAISCDVCGRDKQQTNHWFVVYDQGAELRVSGWNAQARTSTKAKHLCGQTCLHKLVDDFMARTIAMRGGASKDETPALEETPTAQPVVHTDASFTSRAAHPVLSIAPSTPSGDIYDSSARLIGSAGERSAVQRDPVQRDPGQLDPVQPNPMQRHQETGQGSPADRPTYNPRAWHAEAWKREKEREKRSAHNPPNPRRRSIA